MDEAAQFDNLRAKLKLRHNRAQDSFATNYPQAASFFEQAGLDLGRVRQHAGKILAAGSLGGALLLSPPKAAAQTLLLPEPVLAALGETFAQTDDPQGWLVRKLGELLPPSPGPLGLPFLGHDLEKTITQFIKTATGIAATPSLEGEHLNTNFGVIGAEQHLPRFPGDAISLHDEFPEAGLTASRGAFGWFSEDRLTPEAKTREKYYLAVQTMYLPDWDRRWAQLKDWYKWRKMVVVNPQNGQAVVAVVGDAGPAAWTGKHFGGSPEVMAALGGSAFKKGPVLIFFVDDAQNQVPLGPVDYAKLAVPVVKSS